MTSSRSLQADSSGYVHGYSLDEADRLADQADVLSGLLHDGIGFAPGSRVLELGCGVGAQTRHLVEHSPGARFVAVDVALDSLATARARFAAHAPGADVEWVRADVRSLPFDAASFDAVFVCFVLEHLHDPEGALQSLRHVLRPGGRIVVVEGDHGSAFFHPRSAAAQRTIDALIELQHRNGGDALVGRRLQPLLTGAGFRDVSVRPVPVYADPTRPDLVEGFTQRTFIAMVHAVGADVLAAGLLSAVEWDTGIEALRRTTSGTFHYAFFTAEATK